MRLNVLIMMFLLVFCIDVNRMINDKPIFFSTWWIDYFPPEDLKDDKLQLAIKEYLVKLCETPGDCNWCNLC